MKLLDTDAIEARVQKEVLAGLLAPIGMNAVKRDEDLLSLFDSLQVLRLTVGVESAFGIKIDNSELTTENVGTLGRLGTFIEGKLKKSH